MVAFTAKPPFTMQRVTKRPILIGIAEKTPYRGQTNSQVVFASGLERTEIGWRVMAGINDRQIMHVEISDAELKKNFSSVNGIRRKPGTFANRVEP